MVPVSDKPLRGFTGRGSDLMQVDNMMIASTKEEVMFSFQFVDLFVFFAFHLKRNFWSDRHGPMKNPIIF